MKQAVQLALKGEDAWGLPEGYDPVRWITEAGDRVANKAASKGTNVHSFAEEYMLGKEPNLEDYSKAEQKHAQCFLQFVRDFAPEPVLVEKVLTFVDKNNKPVYCGTMDLVAKLYWKKKAAPPDWWVDGETWILDYKASSKEPRPSHALQASAYRYATHWLDEDLTMNEMVPVDRAAVILLNGGPTDSCYRFFPLDSSPVVFSVFKSLLRISHFVKVEDSVIGELL